MGYPYTAVRNPPALVGPPPIVTVPQIGQLTSTHPVTVPLVPHHSTHVTLYTTRLHCAPPKTMYTRWLGAPNTSITATLASSGTLI
ncbi:uncharacterized protein G2W53_040121 [Senna tora]|uniref:Uncharacterized protein n=1 Tax=Senna tora TaxID=362788 RepID=A0A834SS76_9FABA|nr:uncharacterized protein G2W53_040121 [Senna tora]